MPGAGSTRRGAEWKATDELARRLYDMMKPKVMRADIYRCKSMYIHLNQNPPLYFCISSAIILYIIPRVVVLIEYCYH